MAQLEKEFPHDFRFVYRHFPLNSIHDKAALAAQAAEAAGLQKKFWEMHDLLFEHQQEWSALTVEQFNEWLVTQAADLKLDVTKFKQDMNGSALTAEIQAAWERGQKVGLPGTPFMLLNGQVWPNSVPMDYFGVSTVIKLTLLEKRQFTACPPMTIDQAKRYVATLHTEKGDIVLELFADQAPLAVNSFIFLARNGWYNGVTFHRVITDFVAQAGDPTGTGYGGPGYAFKNETSPDLLFDREGLLAMANAGADSNGSQFFITYGPTPDLNGNYTIFGRVIEGMDVARKLTPRNPAENSNLPPGDKILSVSIEEK